MDKKGKEYVEQWKDKAGDKGRGNERSGSNLCEFVFNIFYLHQTLILKHKK